MPVPLYTQTIVAFIWVFDRTLIPGNQQEPLFAEYGVDPDVFWAEVEKLPDYYRARGLLVEVDGSLTPDAVTERLLPALAQRVQA